MNEQLESMIANMPEKTGKSLEQWHQILAKENFAKHGEAVKHLKSEYGIGHGFANTIVSLFNQKDKSEEDLTSLQYKGKENLKPIFEAILEFTKSLGSDVKVSPKKTSVSLIRKKQFALIKPATKSRIDLGLKFKDRENSGRLQDSGPFGTMCSHRVIIQSLDEVDDELKSLIKDAFEESI